MKKLYCLIIVSFILVSCSQPTAVVSTPTETVTIPLLPTATSSPMPSNTVTPTLAATTAMIPTLAGPLPTPSSCGPWSSPDGSVGAAISQKYGELRNCLFFDNSWIITTLGLKGQSGIVAVYRCTPADSTCLDSQADHPLSKWKYYEPPCSGGFTVARADEATGKILLLGGCRIWFNVANGTFDKGG